MEGISQSQPAVNRVEGGRIPWVWVALTVVVLEIALPLSAVGWVAIYSHFIEPGHHYSYYHKHAEFASPIVSVVVGIPFLYFACRWVGRKAGSRAVATGLLVWLILFIIDVVIILVVGPNAYIVAMATISHLTKMLGAYFGGKAALRDVLRLRRGPTTIQS